MYLKNEFIIFPGDAGRIFANLEMAYTQWLEAQQAYAELPATMYWQAKQGVEYFMR